MLSIDAKLPPSTEKIAHFQKVVRYILVLQWYVITEETQKQLSKCEGPFRNDITLGGVTEGEVGGNPKGTE